jgi:hypothetical protein
MRRHPFAALIPLLLVPRLASPQGEPLGPEFRVNTLTSLEQSSSSVAAAGADFVVVWHSEAEGDGTLSIRGQRYDGAGNALGAEFRVNSFTTNPQVSPAVGANASGAFVVVWTKQFYVGPVVYGDVFGQRYDASGAPVGEEFLVSMNPAGDFEGAADIAVAPSGAFMVVWTRAPFFVDPPPPPPDKHPRRNDRQGVPPGPDFIVVWSSLGQDGSGYGVFGQRYAAAGEPLGPEFRVNAYTPGFQRLPFVGTDPSGNFVVAWDSGSSGQPPEPGVFAQRFASTGAPLGPEFRVNTSTPDLNYGPAIAVDGGGNFVIAWDNTPASGVGEVFAQRYSSLGEPSGPEFRVNTTTTGWQRRPSVASTPAGTFLVTWDSSPVSDDNLRDVFGQRFGGVFPVELREFHLE